MRTNTKPSPTLPAAVTAVALLSALVAVGASSAGAQPSQDVAAAARTQSTILISRTRGGKVPNGASTNAVMSNDKRYVRAIAFESEASDLGPRDRNGLKDVYAVLRGNHANNKGTAWKPGRNILISRTPGGAAGNGESYSPAIGGGFHSAPKCVAFLSAASNLVRGDTNSQPDAFVKKLRSGKVRRVLPSGGQPKAPATAVAVSGDCKLIAFVQGGKLYVSKGGRKAKRVSTPGTAADPSFSTGLTNDLVYGARGGAYLRKNGTGHARLVGRGGRNPAYNDLKNRVVAYEKRRGGHWQIASHGIGKVDKRIGKREKIVSDYHGNPGNGDSRDPVVGNSGFYVTFESDAGNLGTSASGRSNDGNDATDVFLYTDVRKLTLIESVDSPGGGLPAGGNNPSMSYYANYITFDSPAQLSSGEGNRQIFMRYLGGI